MYPDDEHVNFNFGVGNFTRLDGEEIFFRSSNVFIKFFEVYGPRFFKASVPIFVNRCRINICRKGVKDMNILDRYYLGRNI